MLDLLSRVTATRLSSLSRSWKRNFLSISAKKKEKKKRRKNATSGRKEMRAGDILGADTQLAWWILFIACRDIVENETNLFYHVIFLSSQFKWKNYCYWELKSFYVLYGFCDSTRYTSLLFIHFILLVIFICLYILFHFIIYLFLIVLYFSFFFLCYLLLCLFFLYLFINFLFFLFNIVNLIKFMKIQKFNLFK